MDSSPSVPTSSKQPWNAVDPWFEISNAAKYRNYERDYLRWIHHKYFSTDVLGIPDPVYEHISTIEDFVIRATKNAPLKYFSDSKASLEFVPGASDGQPPSTGRKKQARR